MILESRANPSPRSGEGGSSRSEEPGGASGLQCRQNRLHHRIQLSIDFRIGKAKNFVTGTAQVLIPREVAFSIPIESMLGPIDLDNDSRSAAFEVNNISQYGGLPSEMMAERAKPTKLDPELYFLGRHGLAQLAGDLVGHGRRHPTRFLAPRGPTLP